MSSFFKILFWMFLLFFNLYMPVDTGYNIFYETQTGGLCRKHSLNAFFGFSKITTNDFNKWIKLYNNYTKNRFCINTSSSDFDIINSDQTNLVSFILKQHKIHTRFYSLNSIYGQTLDKEIIKADFIFVYNSNHIWGVKLVNGKHYKVDSIGGVQLFNIQSLRCMKDIGLLVPVPLKYEWDKNMERISMILDRENINTKQEFESYLKKMNKNNDVLGDLEIPLGVSISILETNLQGDNSEFKKIRGLVRKYLRFISIFTDGNYNNINLILQYIPDIVFELLSLRSK